MRYWWVGILIVLMTGALFAQAEGVVESIGLEGNYRPECWVPMTVQLRPTGNSAAELEIRVIQEDLDHDRVVATRTVTVTPDVGGRSSEPQRFWMYFRPQPTDKGLADASIGGSVKQLDQQLKVVLADKSGKTIANLPITQQSLKRVDVGPAQEVNDVRTTKFVLCVTDGTSLPSYAEYQNSDGIAEQPLFVMIRPRDLPEDVRGYEMVDEILWLGASAPDPKRSLEEPRFRALEQWVRQGGMLVVCQGPEATKLKGFESILPVEVKDYRESADLQPLPEMGSLNWDSPPEEAKQPRRTAFAAAKPGSVVVREKNWGDTGSPFLVRGRLGSGCVTWVAVDLGEPAIARSLRKGWVRIWDEIFGWRNTPSPMKTDAKTFVLGPYARELNSGNSITDLGVSFESGGNLGMTASAYVLVAVLFFAVYWVAAGPGLYAYLSLKKLPTLNWFLFGAIAVAAAFLAVAVVRVVQSKSPTVEHVTLIRAPAGEYATVQSRIGLYVPSDGMKELELSGTTPQTTNWITPYPEHPIRTKVLESSKFLAMKQYQLPIEDATSNENVRVSIPWRSTMKEIQTRWNGDLPGRVEGQAWLTGRVYPDIAGTLANGTPWDLKEIYLVYHLPLVGDGTNAGGDKVIYIPKWAKGQVLDLTQLLTSDNVYRIGKNITGRESMPGYDNVVYGGMELLHRGWGNEVPLGEGWVGYWYSTNTVSSSDMGLALGNDSGSGAYAASLPICSLFDRIPPMRNAKDTDGTYKPTRRDIARIGARFLNVSPALMAGNLVVLAQTKAPLPIPLTVDGDTPKGDGVILCQYLLPLGQKAAVAVEKTTVEKGQEPKR